MVCSRRAYLLFRVPASSSTPNTVHEPPNNPPTPTHPQHAARGVHANPTAKSGPLSAWAAAALEGGLGREEAARAKSKEAVGAAAGPAEAGDVESRRERVAAIGSVIQGRIPSKVFGDRGNYLCWMGWGWVGEGSGWRPLAWSL